MLRGICRCLHYFYIVDCYCRVGRHFQRRSLLVSSCPQSAFGLTGGYCTAAPSELFCVRASLLFAYCRLVVLFLPVFFLCIVTATRSSFRNLGSYRRLTQGVIISCFLSTLEESSHKRHGVVLVKLQGYFRNQPSMYP